MNQAIGYKVQTAFKCQRCGHEWIPRYDRVPKQCAHPNCRSQAWWKPRVSITRPKKKDKPKDDQGIAQ